MARQGGINMETSENILELQNISVTFQNNGEEIKVLDDFSLNIREGDLNVILGPTGCGKTTLLNMLAGILKCNQGKINYTDSNIQSKTRCVFQHYTLFPWLRLIKNIEFGLKMQHIDKRERYKKSKEMLSSVGLESFENHFPHELSGGMRQRAAIAQALVTEPKLLLMDEPFGALDDFTRTELQELLMEIHRKTDITTIFVTHSIDEAIKLGDRIILLSRSPAAILEDIRIDKKADSNDSDKLYIQLRKQLHSQFTMT